MQMYSVLKSNETLFFLQMKKIHKMRKEMAINITRNYKFTFFINK